MHKIFNIFPLAHFKNEVSFYQADGDVSFQGGESSFFIFVPPVPSSMKIQFFSSLARNISLSHFERTQQRIFLHSQPSERIQSNQLKT